MPETDKYSYPSPEERDYIGRRMGRVDGVPKSTGRARYTYDYNPKGLLYGAFVRCPYAHARVTSIDTSEAEKMPGVKAMEIVQKPGSEIQWAGDEIIAVAAVDEPTVRDAVRAVKVEYEELPHLVIDSEEPPRNIPPDTSPLGLDDLQDMAENQMPAAQMIKEINERGITFKPEEAPLDRMPPDIANVIKSAKQKPPEKKAPSWYKPAAAETQGDAEAAFRAPDAVVSEGLYGLPVIVHCCLETHGAVAEWTDNDHLLMHVSTQYVSGIPGQMAEVIGIPAANIRQVQENIGGGFGSKFGPDRLGNLQREALEEGWRRACENDAQPRGGIRGCGLQAIGICTGASGGKKGWHADSVGLVWLGHGRSRRRRLATDSLSDSGSRPQLPNAMDGGGQ